MTFTKILDELNLRTSLGFEKLEEDTDHLTIGASCSTPMFEEEFFTLADIIPDNNGSHNVAVFFSFPDAKVGEKTYQELALFNKKSTYFKAAIYPDEEDKKSLGITAGEPLLSPDETVDYIVNLMELFLSDEEVPNLLPLLKAIK